MGDAASPNKKSRFFSGGKSLLTSLQTTFPNRSTGMSETAPQNEEKSLGIASANFSKSDNSQESTEGEVSDELLSDSDTEPLQPSRMSAAATALQNFSLNPYATRRQGLGPDAFKQLTSKTLLPTAAPQLPSSSSSRNQTPPVFPNSLPQAQDVNLRARGDPSKSINYSPHLRQPFLRREHDPSRGGSSTTQPQPHSITNIPNTGISNLPLHATLTPTRAKATTLERPRSTVPRTLYTSPNRVERAVVASHKRKRAGLILPPPAYIYTRTNSPDFNIFPAILLYPELCFHLAAHFTIESLVALYAISRDFHTILDSRFTTVILSQSLAKAPESSRIFSFRCYAHLCRRDPAARIPHPDSEKARLGISRAVPSFRWLRMVIWREKVVHEIMAIMAEDGVPLPNRCSLALKRMWFILDIPDNARRIGYIHSNTLVPDLDLYFMMCLFVKLDMRFNDPCAQNVYHGLRKLVLAHRSLTYLLRVLKRQELRTQYDVLQAWIRCRYIPLPDEVGVSIFGVKANEVGKGRYEYWGKKTADQLGREVQALLRPEQLVMREAVRRGLRFRRHFLRSLLYGYIRPDTLENYAPRELGRRDPRLADEYQLDDEVGGEMIPQEEGVRDPLLDLGERKAISALCVKIDNMTMDSEENVRRKKLDEFLDRCMEWSRNEREWESMDVDE